MRKRERLLQNEVEEFLRSVWPSVMRDWQGWMTEKNERYCGAVLVTRKCLACHKQARLAVVANHLSPERPAGDRAYCNGCKKVTESLLLNVCGLTVHKGDSEQ